jgi:hypothetical protein
MADAPFGARSHAASNLQEPGDSGWSFCAKQLDARASFDLSSWPRGPHGWLCQAHTVGSQTPSDTGRSLGVGSDPRGSITRERLPYNRVPLYNEYRREGRQPTETARPSMGTGQVVAFPAPRRFLLHPAQAERQGFMARVKVKTPATISVQAREVAKRVHQLPEEVVASFAAPDAKERASRLQGIATEIHVEAQPVVNWLERRRHPQTAELVVRQLCAATVEAIACAGSEIHEYAGGRLSPPVGRPSPGLMRYGAMLVAMRLIAAKWCQWADEIDAESVGRGGQLAHQRPSLRLTKGATRQVDL